MAIAGDVTFKVDTDTLTAQAEQVRTLASNMRSYYNELTDIIDSTKNYWLGEAGEKHRKLYDDKKDDIDKLLRRIAEHPNDLEMIAGNYVSAENTNTAEANQLSGDVIS